MIEHVLRDALKDLLDVPVVLEEVDGLGPRFVLLEKTGSREINHIERATFAVQSYGGSLYDAALLNEKVKKAMEEVGTYDVFSRVKRQTDYNFTDVSTKRYRYQAVYDVVY